MKQIVAFAVTTADQPKRYIQQDKDGHWRLSHVDARRRCFVSTYESAFKFLKILTSCKPCADAAGWAAMEQDLRDLVGINVYVKVSIETEDHVELGSMSFVPNPIPVK
ncbi:hypothetical protein EVB87_204 [Rhizobium phage RHph_N28_1]|nr:hypothetical protein EVB87_204 [Rhizobium phage RHph_N28_1]QIG74233.1 hypothetical protein EVC07_205 [Rhizobium phage RHph_N42]QXV73893.1 hypothetical protein [Rhizobium phage RHph_N46]